MINLHYIIYLRAGIMLVKIDDDATALEYGIEDTPELVYFENEIPHLYSSKLYFKYKICNTIQVDPIIYSIDLLFRL